MRFLTCNPEQGYLLPPSVHEVLGEEHVPLWRHGVHGGVWRC